ncbi:MAG: PfkB family carbohydrate kinase [Solirubrobacteraceae bacterium]
MTRVAVVGHIEWVDFVPIDRFPVPGSVVHATGSFARVGGGGGVAAGVLAEMGASVDFFVALGRDAQGEAAVAQLSERGVRMHVAWRSEPTRRAVTLLEGGERTIITIGRRVEPVASDELPWELLREATGVYVTAGDAGALKLARQAGVVVASPRARHALENDDVAIDALVYSASDVDESAWADRVSARTRLLVATEGPAGGRWWGKESGRWSPAPLNGEPQDAYGCGDSFAAGFTFGLAGGASVAEAAAVGAEAGARALVRRGAP